MVYKKLVANNDRDFNKASTNYYLNYNDLFVLRHTNATELFHDPKKRDLSITVVITDNVNAHLCFSLKIKIEKPQSIEDAYFRIFNSEQPDPAWFDEFVRFST
ncbi:MAG: hypothetical protein COY08_04725 [Piscirickettsiaceae bacterium CG_4_10_14_0_2_um_filter_44_336]|nr:MAG: hypothetical protein COY08_04725 [Piscirickettsiaceae bacterium CG_4_10_14_0_2_um_filter_44_336]